MLKYKETQVVFQEIPDEITLAINITGCQIQCPECHSKHLWEDIGTELSPDILNSLITKNKGITCICFMGGDHAPLDILDMAKWLYNEYPLKIAWYSGNNTIQNCILKHLEYFDYIKIGNFNPEFGPLNNPKTNQKLYKILKGTNELLDITYRFWKS